MDPLQESKYYMSYPFLGSHIAHVVLEPDPHVHMILLTNGNSDTTVGDGVWVQRSFTGELKHREYYIWYHSTCVVSHPVCNDTT